MTYKLFPCHVEKCLLHLYPGCPHKHFFTKFAAGSTAGATGASVSKVSAPTPLDIPDSEDMATPEGSTGRQQLSPLLMSIKKLVSQQAAVESEASPIVTPAAEASSAGVTGLLEPLLA